MLKYVGTRCIIPASRGDFSRCLEKGTESAGDYIEVWKNKGKNFVDEEATGMSQCHAGHVVIHISIYIDDV